MHEQKADSWYYVKWRKKAPKKARAVLMRQIFI